MVIEDRSHVWGNYVYCTIWTPVLGKLLSCKRELDNAKDRYAAIAVCRVDGIIVGHIPRKISFLCRVFIKGGSTIQCIVNGDCQYSHDLPQGVWKYPVCWCLVSTVEEKDLNKVKRGVHYFTEWTEPDQIHTLLQNRPDKLEIMWGAQLLSIALATVLMLSLWHPTVTMLPKAFTLCAQWQRTVFIDSRSWHGCGI